MMKTTRRTKRFVALAVGVLVASAMLAPAFAAKGGGGQGGGKPPKPTPTPTPTPIPSYSDTWCRTTAVSWTNDPCAGRQWGLDRVQAPGAWGVTRGAGVTVAVIDTGADFNHTDLASNLISLPGSDVLQNAYVCGSHTNTSTAIATDQTGHGTHVAGIIAAVAGNAFGVAGVAPGVKVLPVRALGHGDSEATVARGICFAADNGAKVINLSLGTDITGSVVAQLGTATRDAIAYAVSKGVAVIAAAGNSNFPVCTWPANELQAMCVGATTRNDVRAGYSNYGPNISVVAPGGADECDDDAIWSTYPKLTSFCGNSLSGFAAFSGTSQAAPHAAAVAALVVAAGKASTPSEIYDRLKTTSDDLGTPGFDPEYGWGRVNACRAVGACA